MVCPQNGTAVLLQKGFKNFTRVLGEGGGHHLELGLGKKCLLEEVEGLFCCSPAHIDLRVNDSNENDCYRAAWEGGREGGGEGGREGDKRNLIILFVVLKYKVRARGKQARQKMGSSRTEKYRTSRRRLDWAEHAGGSETASRKKVDRIKKGPRCIF